MGKSFGTNRYFFSSTCIRCSLQADCHRGVTCRGRPPPHPHHCSHFYMLQVRSCYTQVHWTGPLFEPLLIRSQFQLEHNEPADCPITVLRAVA